MRVLCEGWKRVDKYHKLMNHDISRTNPSSEELRDRDKVYINLDDDEVVISSGVENLKMNGNFSVEVRLSKKEIINLASIVLAKEPFGKVIRGLSSRSKLAV